jgi:hypothetical protein
VNNHIETVTFCSFAPASPTSEVFSGSSLSNSQKISESRSTEPFSQSESNIPGTNVAAIVGAALGALAGIACLVSTIGGGIYFWKRRRSSDEARDNSYQLSEFKIANRKSLRSSPEVGGTVSGMIDSQKLSKFEEIGRGAKG